MHEVSLKFYSLPEIVNLIGPYANTRCTKCYVFKMYYMELASCSRRLANKEWVKHFLRLYEASPDAFTEIALFVNVLPSLQPYIINL